MKVNATGLKIIFWKLKKQDAKKHADWPKPDAYKTKKNVDALGDGQFDHQFDVVYANPENRLGRTLIDIHGGAYIYSYRDNNYGFASVFAAKGYDVVTLDYPHNNKKQGSIEQIRVLAKQLQYLAAHTQELGLAEGPFGLIGDSAGGHFALLLAEASCNKSIQEKLGINLDGVSFRGVAVSSPVYDYLTAVQAPVMTHSAKKMMYGPNYKDVETIKLISPRTYVDSLKLPVFLNTCLHDFIGVLSQTMLEDMESLGIKHTYCYIDSQDPYVDHVHNVTKISLPESVQVNEGILAFFEPLFHKK